MSNLKPVSEHACFGGLQRFYEHASKETGTSMRFSVYLPPQALRGERCPALFYLAGLTCTEETFATKSGAQRVASELGLVLVAPDTSPRGVEIAGDRESWDFGVAAGFYVDATDAPWATNYRMYSYVVRELFSEVMENFPVDQRRVGIFGHSMGGHGALVIALRNPDQFRSVSAFAPIANPVACPWGIKAFTRYLGVEQSKWTDYDATLLIRRAGRAVFPGGILIDQGLDDKFLEEQLYPETLRAACEIAGQPLRLRKHPGYDHGYYFISSFMEDHLRHHASELGS
ncbi:S-formylglutathione hydrolase [Cupriavidus metallidurans]|uniref:S-formylglutathione hydrolase n=1 Tax=Cupriavidus TaxID=106589 RepID=UPI00049328EF|nr:MULTISPECIES: S-formylglutathione hydrolase [Cupriavidus]AVA33685.1 S-formylglutathione hydrolase [Cupriavidus metallidurans]MDE4920294.1 S-formylglutathione hydrolase [Cupriavidus metallidurans]MDE4922790.1 S-formylglutathione hydrolase [Cupriavidus metallidurans]MWL92113.1 S-formylglutathione hydrolase [Cupriavidus sp. SW-Y-13]